MHVMYPGYRIPEANLPKGVKRKMVAEYFPEKMAVVNLLTVRSSNSLNIIATYNYQSLMIFIYISRRLHTNDFLLIEEKQRLERKSRSLNNPKSNLPKHLRNV